MIGRGNDYSVWEYRFLGDGDIWHKSNFLVRAEMDLIAKFDSGQGEVEVQLCALE